MINYNELIDAICELVNLAWDSTSKEEFERLDNAGAEVIDCLEKLQQFEAIGTIDEFKALKEKNETLKALYKDARKEGNNLLARARNNAIYEFAEKLCDIYCEQSMTVVFENRIKADILTLDGVTELAWEVAEQLKAGVENR